MHRKLGISVICVGLVQLALYLALSLGPKEWGPLFYFDPRLGWFFLESFLSLGFSPPGITSWVTAAATLLIGFALLRGAVGIKTYLAAEAVLALPTLAFIVLVAAANLSPTEGFSIGELLVPFVMFSLCSVLPFGIAFFTGSGCGVVV